MSKDSKRNCHEDKNAMIQNMNGLEALGKEMEQVSEENDEDKYNQTRDSRARSDLN